MKLLPPKLLLVAILCCGAIGETMAVDGKMLETSAQSVQIAVDGKARLPIVIAPGSSEALRKSALELAGFLKRMTGAEFAVEESTVAKGITLGTLQQFPDENLKEPLVIKDVYDGLEAFVIRTDAAGIRLLANTDKGVNHAIYRFLNLIGCRWFFPGSTWEVIPQNKTLSFNLNENSRPALWSRDIWFGRAKQRWEPGDPDGTAVFRAWQTENRLGESLQFNASHAWQAIPVAMKKEFEGHPEYFALVDGKRTPPQFCVTNPGLQQAVIAYTRAYFVKTPEADMVSLDPADQPGWCTCDECKKLGHHSNQAFYLANVAAKELVKTNPGKFIGILAYSWHSDPPSFVLEPNVYVMLTAGMNASKFTFDELFDMWIQKCSHIGIYEYYSYWEMDRGMMPGKGRSNYLDQMGERIQNFTKNKVNSISAQSANCWGVNGFGYYVAANLMWNPEANVPALKKDFYEKAFGPAAAVMERYYERLNLSNHPLPGKSLLRQCADDIEQAFTLAKSRPDVQARLIALQENLIYNYLGQKVDAASKDDKKAATLDWFTWAYRTRNNYMNDWITFRSAIGRLAAEEMGEPTWFWRNTPKDISQNPWRKNEPVTSAEIASLLKSLNEFTGDIPQSPEKKFSGDYVLVNTGQKAAATINPKMRFSGSAIYQVASMTGEPLKFMVAKRDTGVWDKPDAKYTLSTLEGKEIISGEIPVGEQELELKVPGPGVYRFTCKSNGPGWNVDFREVKNALAFERDKICRPAMIEAAYFYVPKDTKEIAAYAATGLMILKGPDGSIVLRAPANGQYLSVPVPAGMSGKVWSVSGKLANLWFFNVPTLLSPDPEWVFIPREVAKADGLTIALPK